jgi:molecular chaperone DnaK (HSP70)
MKYLRNSVRRKLLPDLKRYNKNIKGIILRTISTVNIDHSFIEKMAKEKIIGIDLGTSNSAAAVLQAGKPVIIPSAEGTTAYGKAFPSVVAFTKDGQMLVGEPARRQAVSNPEGTVMAAKRKMGLGSMGRYSKPPLSKFKMTGKNSPRKQISGIPVLSARKLSQQEKPGEQRG